MIGSRFACSIIRDCRRAIVVEMTVASSENVSAQMLMVSVAVSTSWLPLRWKGFSPIRHRADSTDDVVRWGPAWLPPAPASWDGLLDRFDHSFWTSAAESSTSMRRLGSPVPLENRNPFGLEYLLLRASLGRVDPRDAGTRLAVGQGDAADWGTPGSVLDRGVQPSTTLLGGSSSAVRGYSVTASRENVGLAGRWSRIL